jgi:hypothetical protein
VLATMAGGATEQVVQGSALVICPPVTKLPCTTPLLHPQIVHDVHGYLYPTGEDARGRYKLGTNAAALAAAMCIVVRQPERAAAWGAAGQARVRAYLSEQRIMHEFGALLLSAVQLPARDPDSSLPLPELEPSLAPLSITNAAEWTLPHAALPRDRWIAAAALHRRVGGADRPAVPHSVGTAGALADEHPVYVLAPPAAAAAESDAVPPAPSLFILEPESQALKALPVVAGPDWPRAGASLAAGSFDHRRFVVLAGGVASAADPCRSAYSPGAWLVEPDTKGGVLAVSQRLPDVPELLLRPLITVAGPVEATDSGAGGTSTGHTFVHVLGGAPVAGNRALSAVHWRLSLDSVLHPTSTGVQADADATAKTTASSWERLPDVPLPSLDAAVVVLGVAEERGTGKSAEAAAM